MKHNPLPSLETLRSELEYNPESGEFSWRNKRNGKGAGKGSARRERVGTQSAKGYIDVWLFGKFYKLHRIAWKMVYGKDPVDQIDHIDGDKSNNRIKNLREATNSENRSNTGKSSTNKSGIKGVCFHTKSKTWRAQISKDGRKYLKDGFPTKEAAADYIVILRVKLHKEFSRHD